MRWYAKVANGDVEGMTLDELDVAYENGVIDAGTLVLAPDATDWPVELGELAGLGESPALGPPPATTRTRPFLCLRRGPDRDGRLRSCLPASSRLPLSR